MPYCYGSMKIRGAVLVAFSSSLASRCASRGIRVPVKFDGVGRACVDCSILWCHGLVPVNRAILLVGPGHFELTNISLLINLFNLLQMLRFYLWVIAIRTTRMSVSNWSLHQWLRALPPLNACQVTRFELTAHFRNGVYCSCMTFCTCALGFWATIYERSMFRQQTLSS
jgi:hypothetical protein